MKKIFSVFVLLILMTMVALAPNSLEDIKNGLTGNPNINSNSEKEEVLSSKTDEAGENSVDFEFDNQSYRAVWFKVGNLSDLDLLSNFEEKLTSDEILETEKCKSLVSGGFYTTENFPIGLFINNFQTLNNYQSNSLFNGVLSINDFSTPRITKDMPADNLRIALQAGPLLIENSYKLKLSIRNDKQARRIVAAITGENELYFLAIYDKESVFSGPYLETLPEILKMVENKTNVAFADAINLDGGSHSVFITEGVSLPETSMAGSFFCAK